MLRVYACVLSAAVLFASDAGAASKKNVWELYDEGEERGWSIENDAGNALAVSGCVMEAKSRAAVLRLTGYMDKYLGADAKKEYIITATIGDHEDNVFSTPSEYFGTEFMFQTALPKDLKSVSIKICARPASGEPADPECNTFKGPGFAKLVKDLCG